MKKVIAAAVAVMLCANGAFAFGWDDVTQYASDAWGSISGYVMSWFTSDETPPADDDSLPAGIAGKWDKLSGSLNDALTLRDKQETLPDSAWFGEDKASNSRKINAILDRALVILSGGEAGNARAEAVRLRARISELRGELDALRNQRITAPDSASFFFFWRMTKPKIDAKISGTEAEIRRTESQMGAINSRLADELRGIGLELTDTQTDILLNSVTGEDIIQNTVIFDNVRAVVEKLEELSRNDTNNLEIIRRYTGMYLVLNDLLIHTQEELVRKMETDYRPRLKNVITEAESLRKQAMAKSNDKAYTSAQRKAFALNAKSNAATIEAAGLYGELLDSQKASIMSSIRSLRLNRDLAENTYRTVRSSGELRELIHSGLQAFDTVGRLSMPELQIFESGAMRAEFDEINRRLAK
ncbi:MAG: hypothetical protein IJP86_04705 [Synergistaceae bacterium]|nr:hypothetical protein [Synergistaceae bacterium]